MENNNSVTNHVTRHVTNNTKISISALEKVCEFHKNLCKLVEENEKDEPAYIWNV